MNLKFLIPLIGFSLGIYLTADLFPGLWFSGICLGCALIFWMVINILSKNPVRSFRLTRFHSIWVLLLFAGAGSLDFYFFNQSSIEKDISNQLVSISGEIEEVNTLAEGDRFKIKVFNIEDIQGNPIRFRNIHLLLFTNGLMGNKGDLISFSTRPISASSVGNNNNREIDYYAHLNSDDIDKIGESNSFINYFQRLKDKLIILIEKSTLNRSTSNFIISIVLGDKSFLSSEERGTFNASGLAHVLALSGMHVAVMLSFILILLFPLSLIGFHKSRFLISIIFIWCYVLLTGASPSTVRAAIMATFLIGSFILERKNSALNALMAAVLIILFFDPLALWNIGLQLSFICVSSIIIFTNKINPVEPHNHPQLYQFINLILITLITTFSTWVLIAYYFKTFPLLFLPANILLVPLFPVVTCLGVVYIFFLLFGFDCGIIARTLEFFNYFLYKLCSLISFQGNSELNIQLPVVSVIIWLAGILILAVAFYTMYKKYKRPLMITASIIFLVSLIIPVISPQESSTSLKILHSFTKIEAQYKKNSETNRLTFPRNSISKFENGDIRIISVDQLIHKDSIEQLKLIENSKKNYIIVGPGANLEQIADIINSSTFSKVVLHSGVGKNKKAELIRLLNDTQKERIYSLRDKGSLDFDL